MATKQPIQPMYRRGGQIRFHPNQIVDDLLEFAQSKGFGLNEIARRSYSQEDRCQFAQLIGYSLSGYHELSYVSDAHAKEATKAARKIDPKAGGCRDEGCEIHCGVELEGS